MKYTLIFSPRRVTKKVSILQSLIECLLVLTNRLQDKGFPIDGLKENTILVAVYPNVGSRFDGVRGMFTKEIG